MTSTRDQRRYDKMQAIGCLACLIDGRPGVPGDIHHLVDRGNRAASGGNSASLILCPYHHRGTLPPNHTAATATLAYGPSLANGSKPFHERYGTQRTLLAKVNELLGTKT